MLSGIIEYLPLLIAIVGFILLFWLTDSLLLRRQPGLGAEAKLPRQLALLVMLITGALLLLLLFPMSDNARGQVLSLLGIVFTAVIALASTTFVANAMAGLMLRVVKSFRPGDFIRIGEQFGRVTERGLFHTEIQTEDRDLSTLPNLYLITNPVTVVHSSGTIISASLSLGYDLPWYRLEKLLKQAAGEAKLQEPFVLVKELGDFSVLYKVSGFLSDITHLITARSNLRKKILDVLHDNGVEIVSPSYMNQRRIEEGSKIIPQKNLGVVSGEKIGTDEKTAEEFMFDKAEKVSEIENKREEQARLNKRLDELKGLKTTVDEATKASLDAEISFLEKRIEKIATQIEVQETDIDTK